MAKIMIIDGTQEVLKDQKGITEILEEMGATNDFCDVKFVKPNVTGISESTKATFDEVLKTVEDGNVEL